MDEVKLKNPWTNATPTANRPQREAYAILCRIYRETFERSRAQWFIDQARYNAHFGPDEKAARMVFTLSNQLEMRRPVSPTVRQLCKELGIPSQGKNRRALFEFLNEYQKVTR